MLSVGKIIKKKPAPAKGTGSQLTLNGSSFLAESLVIAGFFLLKASSRIMPKIHAVPAH